MTMHDRNFRRNNHYVPQFLLRQFSSPEKRGHLWEYRLLVQDARVPEWELRPISRLARTSDLYTITQGDEESDQIERWLDEEFEGPASNAVAAATSGRRLSRDQWHQLIKLYAAQFVRTPTYFLRHKDQWAVEMRNVFSEARDRLIPQLPKYKDIDSECLIVEDHDGFPLRYTIRRHEGLRRSLELQHVTGRKLWMWQLRHALRPTGMVAQLEQYKWSIIIAPQDTSWFLTDNPAVCIRSLIDGTQTLNGGWGMPGSKLMLPLSPTHLLYHQVQCEMHERYVKAHPLLVDHLRRYLVDAAGRSFYSHQKDVALAQYRRRRVDRDSYQDETK